MKNVEHFESCQPTETKSDKIIWLSQILKKMEQAVELFSSAWNSVKMK